MDGQVRSTLVAVGPVRAELPYVSAQVVADRQSFLGRQLTFRLRPVAFLEVADGTPVALYEGADVG